MRPEAGVQRTVFNSDSLTMVLGVRHSREEGVREGFGAERVVERYDGAVVEPGRVLGENHLRTVLEEVAHRSHLSL